MTDTTPETRDGLDVQCPDCMAPAGTPCGDQPHADRLRDSDLRHVEHGTCALCGHPMVRGEVAGAPLDAWHPDVDHAAVCPAIPDPAKDWERYATATNLGLTPGHPGAEHFVPLPVGTRCPECVAGKHINCTGDAWDPVADEPAPCACRDHAGARP